MALSRCFAVPRCCVAVLARPVSRRPRRAPPFVAGSVALRLSERIPDIFSAPASSTLISSHTRSTSTSAHQPASFPSPFTPPSCRLCRWSSLASMRLPVPHSFRPSHSPTLNSLLLPAHTAGPICHPVIPAARPSRFSPHLATCHIRPGFLHSSLTLPTTHALRDTSSRSPPIPAKACSTAPRRAPLDTRMYPRGSLSSNVGRPQTRCRAPLVDNDPRCASAVGGGASSSTLFPSTWTCTFSNTCAWRGRVLYVWGTRAQDRMLGGQACQRKGVRTDCAVHRIRWSGVISTRTNNFTEYGRQVQTTLHTIPGKLGK
ncbi:hypothetical protein C8R44DRAFT_911501 [Mycena epipterygia]|nr:hypothetical protein C8R44DRAFT_911501 [Mycena epipterygia]